MGKIMNADWKFFGTCFQFAISFAKDELTIELTTVTCSLKPKKLFHVVSLNSFDYILLQFVFTWCLSSPFSDVIYYTVMFNVFIRCQFI